ncbi:hypothetical protein UFOVP238_25 [uncultured Caudovirales phage]|uniref:Uncharacterized protein n=1 Tax=uncultured Caudovirales phage TaxID=2100421 RepID=A0A6J7WZ88_9CAUD|nr:hypothetical protein UFOVP238_25 [uncultured Caudovirales phage]
MTEQEEVNTGSTDGEDAVTLAWKEPPPITYGSRRQAYPYDEAVVLLESQPEEWLSLRTGPSNRMDQFKTRFRNFAQDMVDEGWFVECITRSLPNQDVPYEQRKVEVFARLVPAIDSSEDN